jgi:hypothetical protein
MLQAGSPEKLMDFLVGSLVEVVVPLSDRDERLGHLGADDFVHEPAEVLAGIRRANRNGHDDPRRLLRPQSGRGGVHRGSGREPNVYEDDRLSPDRGRFPRPAICLFTPFQLPELLRGDVIDHVRRHVKATEETRVQDPRAAARYCAHRELLLSRKAQLANEKHVEWNGERAGDFVGDGDASAGKGEDEDIRALRVVAKFFGEPSPGLRAITKDQEASSL